MGKRDKDIEARRLEIERTKAAFDEMIYRMIKNRPKAPSFEELKADYDRTVVDIIIATTPKDTE